MKRNKESKARVRIFSWLGLNKSEQMEVDRYLKKHNSNYRVLYKKFKMFNEILMTAADLGFGDEYYFEKQGIVIAGSYNRKSMDKTKWYTVNIDKLNEILRSAQNEQMDCSKWTDGEFKMNNSSAQNE